MAAKEREETQALGLDIVTQVLQVHQDPLDLLDLLIMTDKADMTPGIIQLLKERKVILDHQERLKFQAMGRLTFTLSEMR